MAHRRDRSFFRPEPTAAYKIRRRAMGDVLPDYKSAYVAAISEAQQVGLAVLFDDMEKLAALPPDEVISFLRRWVALAEDFCKALRRGEPLAVLENRWRESFQFYVRTRYPEITREELRGIRRRYRAATREAAAEQGRGRGQ
jgi:hypothetical protein